MEQPRVLLVATNRCAAPEVVPPIALAFLAGALRAAGAEVAALDLLLVEDDDPRPALDRALLAIEPHLVGLSIRNLDNASAYAPAWYAPEVADLAAHLRERRVPVVAGGPAVSIAPRALMDFLGVDLAVRGEGEDVLPALAAALARGEEPPALRGLIRRGCDDLVQPATLDLGALAPPAFDVLDMAAYRRLGASVGVQTRRGCRYACSYCVYPMIEGRRTRLRAADCVAEDVARVRDRFQINHFFLVDSVFNDPPAHALEVARSLAVRVPGVRYSCYLSPRGVDRELADALVMSGCEGAELGTDSLAPTILQRLRKPFGVEDVIATAEACRDAGLPQCHHLVLGTPGETESTLNETLARAEELPADVVILTLGVRVYPRSPLAQEVFPDLADADGAALLQPRYFVSPEVSGRLEELILPYARRNPHWVVPSLGINYDESLLAGLRRAGHWGPAWLLARRRRSGELR